MLVLLVWTYPSNNYSLGGSSVFFPNSLSTSIQQVQLKFFEINFGLSPKNYARFRAMCMQCKILVQLLFQIYFDFCASGLAGEMLSVSSRTFYWGLLFTVDTPPLPLPMLLLFPHSLVLFLRVNAISATLHQFPNKESARFLHLNSSSSCHLQIAASSKMYLRFCLLQIPDT